MTSSTSRSLELRGGPQQDPAARLEPEHPGRLQPRECDGDGWPVGSGEVTDELVGQVELDPDAAGPDPAIAVGELPAEQLHTIVQAVLLRAVRVTADVRCSSPDAYRELFRKLKFRRLLHRITPREDGGYRIAIDKPFSLFQNVAKYGLELALLLPALEACQALELEAEVRWSERAKSLTFRHRGGAKPREGAPELRTEVSELLDALRTLGGWEASPAERILDLPGMGVCVPDLRLRRRRDGAEVFVEVLGYWSRASVWKRVELAEKGLGAKILFAVSSRLRVSEEVLDESDAAALYVYKGKMNPQAVLRKVAGLLSERR